MTTDRKFAAFSKDGDIPSFRMKEIPNGGFCLSAFLVISEAGDEGRVLMGHLNPAAPWDHVGALDKSRVQAHSNGWMLPSSHLIIHESPQETAQRILKEQLGIDEAIILSGPKVVSEVYTPKRFPDIQNHWDLEFIFNGTLASRQVHGGNIWTDLRFLRVNEMSRSEITRSHEDVLESAGFKFLDG